MSPSPTLIGPYRLVRKLGEGGMGEVYEARHETIERQVAIKVLHPQYARDAEINRRFINEARAVNLINHSGLVQISDVGQLANGSLYIVMEYLRGETLGQRLKRLSGWLPISQVLYVAWQVTSALVAAHEVGITHRDLKPDNIMLVADPISPTGERVKLLDFGIARLANDGSGTRSLTGNSILGTPIYMSPEQCRGIGTVGAKSDVYSLGVLLYQLLAGRPPFISAGIGDIINMHISQEPPPLRELAPDISAELATFVHKLLIKDQDLRPAMREVMAELEQFQSRQGSASAQMASEVALVSAAYFGISHEDLSDSLVGILGQELEDEGNSSYESGVSLSAMACEQTAAPALKAPAASPSIPAGEAAQPLTTETQASPRELSPTFVSAGYTLGGRGERWQPPARPWSLISAAVVVGGIAAAAVWLLLPARAVLSRTAPDPTPSALMTERSLPARPSALPPQEAEPTVSWLLNTLPSGAKVLRADTQEVLGITPWRSQPARAIGSLVVLLRYPGFADKPVRLDYAQSSNQTERLLHLTGTQARPLGRPSARDRQRPPVDPPNSKKPDAPATLPFEFVD